MTGLGFVFSIIPLQVCLYWFVRFAARYRHADAAKRMLTVFFGVCTVLYLCHALFYNVYAETGLPKPLETLWAACSLSVYPLYFLYICQLTARPASLYKKVFVLAPGFAVALAILIWDNEVTDTLLKLTTALQVLSVLVFGYRRLRSFDRELFELYAETYDKNVRSLRRLLWAVMFISFNTFVLNLLGREYVITSEWLILFALDPIAILLFMLGFIGYRRSFRPEQIYADNPAEELPPIAEENSTLGNKIENLMVTRAYYLRQNITVSDVAREVGSCRTYVSNYINREQHCSFSEYVNRLRIEHAKMLLLQLERHGTDTKFSVIAHSVGFTYEPSFYRNFFRYTGLTPSAWLEEQRAIHSQKND